MSIQCQSLIQSHFATRFLSWLCVASFFVMATQAVAQVVVEDAWVRATVQGQPSTGAFMKLTAGKDIKLIGAKSSVAHVVELHEMKMTGDMMTMRAVKDITLPAGKAVELKPGGYHVMLINLKKHIVADEQVPITLMVEDPKDKKQIAINVSAKALSLSASMPSSHHNHH